MYDFLRSLRSWRYCVGARLKFWRRSRVPKKGNRDEAVGIGGWYFSRLRRSWLLRRQISLDYITTAPRQNLTNHYTNTTSYTGYFLRSWKYFQRKRFFLNLLASLSKQEHICFPSNLNIFSTIFPSLFSLQNKKFYYMAESVFAMRLVNLRSVTCYTDQNF